MHTYFFRKLSTELLYISIIFVQNVNISPNMLFILSIYSHHRNVNGEAETVIDVESAHSNKITTLDRTEKHTVEPQAFARAR